VLLHSSSMTVCSNCPLYHVDSAARCARALCTVIGYGSSYNEKQVNVLQGYVRRRLNCTPCTVEVDRLLKHASSTSEAVLVWELQEMFEAGRFTRSDLESLLQAMLRVAAVNDFPRKQVRIILSLAKKVGFDMADLRGIIHLLKSQQIVQHQLVEPSCCHSLYSANVVAKAA
jgi:hypothetical protein